MSNNTTFSAFEKSAYRFIEELKNISIKVNLLHDSEVKKANMLIYCVKSIVSCVNKDIEEVEKQFKKRQ